MIEIWKPVIGFKGLYEVSNLGCLRSLPKIVNHGTGYTALRRSKIKKLSLNKGGYLRLSLRKDGIDYNKFIHRLVSESFLGVSCLTVNHIDNNKLNNRIDNLEWLSIQDNHKIAVLRGSYSGSNNPKMAKKLTRKKADKIRLLRFRGAKLREIAEKYNIAVMTVCRIINNKIWI